MKHLPPNTLQKQALKIFKDRQILQIQTTVHGWVDAHDIRLHPFAAREVVAMFREEQDEPKVVIFKKRRI